MEKKKFENRWRNGHLKRTGFLNENGKIDGFVIMYDENGNEKEKLVYENGMRLGNPLIGLTQEQIQKILVEDTENVNPIEFIGEEDESKMKIISLRELSTELKGDKYYK